MQQENDLILSVSKKWGHDFFHFLLSLFWGVGLRVGYRVQTRHKHAILCFVNNGDPRSRKLYLSKIEKFLLDSCESERLTILAFTRRWDKFEESYRIMHFSNGDRCWNGPDRSLKVTSYNVLQRMCDLFRWPWSSMFHIMYRSGLDVD